MKRHRRLPVSALVAVLIATFTVVVLHAVEASGEATASTLVADSYTDSSHRDTNYGDAAVVALDAGHRHGYFKFDVSVPAGQVVTRALFRCWALNSNGAGASIRPVSDNNWTESGITWNNAPSADTSSSGARTGPVAANAYATADVTAAVSTSGTYSFVATTTSNKSWSCASRENAGNHPARLDVTTQATSGAHSSLALPARGTFYYPWYPEAWTQSGVYPATKYTPSAGFYNTEDQLAAQVQDMVYGGFDFAVSSWWGQGSIEDGRFGDLLGAAHGTSLQVAPYYEAEGNAIASVPGSPDPSAAQITDDLNYLSAHYTADPNYLWIAGKPALFVFGDAGDDCSTAARWAAANAAATQQFYVVLKVFAGYQTCAAQPDNWHQYGPAVAEDSQGTHSFSISPGFFRYDASTPRLTRDLGRWAQNIQDMNCSGADFQLVTTFNEWIEGTAVESAAQWASASGSGAYLDALHADQTCPTGSPTPPPSPVPTSAPPTSAPPTSAPPTSAPPTPTPPPTPPPTPTPTPPPPGAHKLLVIPLENHSESEALAQMPHLANYATTYGQATNYSAVAHPSLPNYLAIWGGSTFGVTSDCSVGSSGCVPTAPSVWGQTLSAGGTAKAYQESMTSNCQTGGSGSYAPRHGPWPYWTDSTERAGCAANDVPSGTTTSGALLNDVNAGRLPITGELTPNLCNDAHDCSLSTADNWLAGWLPKIMAGPDYTAGRLTIIITFDEDDGSQGNKVAFVVIDPRLSGKTVTGAFNHYSLTRWLEDNAGVSRLRNAASAPDLRAAFGL